MGCFLNSELDIVVIPKTMPKSVWNQDGSSMIFTCRLPIVLSILGLAYCNDENDKEDCKWAPLHVF